MTPFVAQGTLVSEISDSVSNLINGGLQRLKEDLTGNMHLDISAELARCDNSWTLIIILKLHIFRQLDPLFCQVSSLNNVFASFKTLLEDGAENLDNLHGYLGELSAKLDINHQAIAVKVSALSLAVSPMKDALTNVQNQMRAMLTHLNEAIKVSHFFVNIFSSSFF